MELRRDPPPHITQLLVSGEILEHHLETIEAAVVVTDRRIIVRDDRRVALDLPIEELRRIQLDVERRRPSTLVLVPDQPLTSPQVLSVPAKYLHEVAAAVAAIGVRIEEAGPQT